MENTVRFQTDSVSEDHSLFLASSILVGVNQTIRDVQILVAALLRYALLGAAISDSLMEMVITLDENEEQIEGVQSSSGRHPPSL